MKNERTVIALLGLLVLGGFKDNPAEEPKTTTYGICDCEKTTASAPKFEVTVSEDHTFRYVSTTDPKHPVDVTGNWEWKKKTIVLKDYPATATIHNQWKMDNKFPCITSRKGLEFSRLCEVKKCE